MIRSLGKMWRRCAGSHRRESDEREQFISLLAVRDAFLIVVLFSLMLVPALLFFQGGLPSLGSRVAMLPLAMMLVSGFAVLISWTVRGGGLSLRAVAFRGVVYLGAFLAAGVLLWGISRTGVIPAGVGLLPLATGSVAGVALAVGLQAFASHRNR